MRNLLFITLSVLLVSCATNSDNANEKNGKSLNCIAKQIEDCSCLQVFEPVCGCDDISYHNSCYAECASIMEYTQGECP